MEFFGVGSFDVSDVDGVSDAFEDELFLFFHVPFAVHAGVFLEFFDWALVNGWVELGV